MYRTDEETTGSISERGRTEADFRYLGLQDLLLHIAVSPFAGFVLGLLVCLS